MARKGRKSSHRTGSGIGGVRYPGTGGHKGGVGRSMRRKGKRK